MRTRSFVFGAAVLVGLLLGLSGCRRDQVIPPSVQPSASSGTLRVTLVPEWEGAPLQFYHEYRNVSDYRLTVEFLKFYWGDIRLINGLETMAVSPVELFDMQNGPVTKEWKLSPGTWTGLRTGLGLPSELNHTDPALYPAEHPMSVNYGMYWTWASGYKFVLFDGRYDPDPLSTAPFVNAYAIHTGMDTCYVEMDLLPVLPIAIAQDSTTNVIVRIAVDEFFYSNSDTIDLATEYASHGGNAPLALKFTRNVVRSFSIE